MNNKTSGTALVTGATNGIGYELAKLFAQDGCNALMADDDKVISGFMNKVQAGISNVTSDTMNTANLYRKAKPINSEKEKED